MSEATMMEPQASNKVQAEVERLRKENRLLQDKLRHAERVIQQQADDMRHNETRCDLYARNLRSLLGQRSVTAGSDRRERRK